MSNSETSGIRLGLSRVVFYSPPENGKVAPLPKNYHCSLCSSSYIKYIDDSVKKNLLKIVPDIKYPLCCKSCHAVYCYDCVKYIISEEKKPRGEYKYKVKPRDSPISLKNCPYCIDKEDFRNMISFSREEQLIYCLHISGMTMEQLDYKMRRPEKRLHTSFESSLSSSFDETEEDESQGRRKRASSSK